MEAHFTRVNKTIAALLLIFLSSSSAAFTSADTVISNTANIKYQVNAGLQFSKSSNSNQFVVLNREHLNQGSVTVSGMDGINLFPGNSIVLNIEVKNDGINQLREGRLRINYPADISFFLVDDHTTLISQSTDNGITTRLYDIGKIAVQENQTYSVTLNIPIDSNITSNDIIIDYRANNADITRRATSLPLAARSQSVLQLLKYSKDDDAFPLTVNPTEFMQSDGNFSLIKPPMIEATGVSATSVPIFVKSATDFIHNQIIFIKLSDADQNIDPSKKESIEIDFKIEVNGEQERLKLTETEINSGIFSGYITQNIDDTPTKNNGVLNVYSNSKININYTDKTDSSDSPVRTILVNPPKSHIYIQRTANTANISLGDFIHYTVKLENVDSETINNVTLTDILPHGFRLKTNSVKINKIRTIAPAISANGRALIFSLETMESKKTYTIDYIAAVGAARRGEATSTSHAIANGGAVTSNTAKLNTQIIEELMRSRAILMGQVIIGSDLEKSRGKSGLAGVRIYMEDGRYAITDEYGMYSFNNITPGNHVVQLDLDTLPQKYEAMLHEENTRFTGRAWSQFVDIQGGTLWRADFHVALKPNPLGNISLQISSSELLNNDEIEYQVSLHSETVATDDIRLTFMIPTNTEYKAGSSTLEMKTISEPDINRNMLTFRLGSKSGDWNQKLRFSVQGIAQNSSSELLSKAFMMFNTPEKHNQRTPVIDHSIRVKTTQSSQQVIEKIILNISFESGDDKISKENRQYLVKFAEQIKQHKNLKIHATGHSDHSLFRKGSAKERFGDNYGLSEHRALTIANELRDILRLTPSQVTIEGRGSDNPVADNSSKAGRKANRRVELDIYSEKMVTTKESTSIKALRGEKMEVITQGSHVQAPIINTLQKSTQTPQFNRQWLAKQKAEIEWVYPQKNDLPDIASTRIVIKHLNGQQVTLLQNGKSVEKVNFDGMLKDQSGISMSRWSGVDLEDGDNIFDVTIKDKNGQIIQSFIRTVHFSTDPVDAEIVEEKSTLIADGITPPVIAIRLLDKGGYPVRKGISGQYRIAPPYKAIRSNKFNTDVMPGASNNRQEYLVHEDGIALITLDPTIESGKVKISLPLTNNSTKKLTTRLIAKSGGWVLVGIAEGSVGYKTLSKNSTPLTVSTDKDHLYKENRIAFFAKGQVLGKWLMTIAYDSNKFRPKKNDPELFQTINPDRYYTLYGDKASSDFAAASSEKLYLKLERDEFYALFGDYQTGLNDVKLAKYQRTLTGIKTRYQDEYLDVVVFGSRSNQAFVKDEFRGKGLTGPYQLTRNNIAMNSENIIIEVRDRFRSEVILSTTEMTRYLDYQIDYRTGIITFRQPLFSTDQNFNPQFIVVKYESFDATDRSTTYGGRAEINVNEKLAMGITHINEGRTGGEAKLSGTDITYQLSEKIKLRIEAAITRDKKETRSDIQGSAYLAEIEHQTDKTVSKIYYRDQGSGFGLGQTNSSEDNMRKMGAETLLKATNNMTIKGLAYRQESSANESRRDVIEAQGQGKIGDTHLRLGLRSARDRRGSGRKNDSQQITTGMSHRFIDGKIVTRIDREQNLRRGNSLDFPNRTRMGVDYRITRKSTLFVEQEFTDGEVKKTRNTLAGIKSTPWQGGEIYTGIKQSFNEQGGTTSANVSGRQKWKLTDRWNMNIGAEEVKTLNSSSDYSLTPLEANDFSAGSVGLTYAPGSWMWSTRLEARNSAKETRRQLATSMQSNPNNQLSTLTTLVHSRSEQATTGISQKESDIRLGLAYRPALKYDHNRWIILDKLDLKQRDVSGGTQDENNWRVINSLNANYKMDRWQISLQYAAKIVNEQYNDLRYTSFTDLTGFEMRYDILSDWDAGIHGAALRARKLNHYDYSSGISIGHSMVDNIWISLGYNFTGFYDEDFSRSNDTREGGYVKFRIKFDQRSAKEALQWLKK
ncbi:MAG: OmpA family protein [Gammaproteobacteria bacterium]|nr:OmpA family protein [Gammaproteobacteria bacterium]